MGQICCWLYLRGVRTHSKSQLTLPVLIFRLYLLSCSDWDQDSSSSSTLITAVVRLVDSPAADCVITAEREEEQGVRDKHGTGRGKERHGWCFHSPLLIHHLCGFLSRVGWWILWGHSGQHHLPWETCFRHLKLWDHV